MRSRGWIGGDGFNQFQYGHRYLLLAIGYGWKISGISRASVGEPQGKCGVEPP